MRVACGMVPRALEAAERGLPNTLHAVSLRDGDRLVAMGRVVGDGGTAAIITDICVLEAYRRRGIAQEIMARLMRWCEAELPESCFVSLVADPGAERLYEKAGFQPTEGMSMGYRVGSQGE